MERKRQTQRTRRPVRSHNLRRLTAPLAIVAALLPSAARAIPSVAGPPHVFAYYRPRIALVQVIGTLYNGSQDRGEGSGFLVGDSIVVTDSHVIPRVADYRTVTITVHLGDRGAAPITATLLDRDATADLAILKLAQPQTLTTDAACPLEAFERPVSTPTGTEIIVLGYPVGQNISIDNGLRSSVDDSAPEWQTDVPMNVGVSGGPVFNYAGYLLGFAVRSMVEFGTGTRKVRVEGVNYFTTVATLMHSSLAQRLQLAPPCWRLSDAVPPPAIGTSALGAVVFSFPGAAASLAATATKAEQLSATLLRDVNVSFAKSAQDANHSTSFSKSIAADVGYVITKCELHPVTTSQNRGDRCEIAPGGRSARFSTSLKNGWWAGAATITQSIAH